MLGCRASLGPASQLTPRNICSPAGPFLPPVLLGERCGAQRVPGPPPQLAFIPLPRSSAGCGGCRAHRAQPVPAQVLRQKAVGLSTQRSSLISTAILLPDPARSGAVCPAQPPWGHLVWHHLAPSPNRHPQGPAPRHCQGFVRGQQQHRNPLGAGLAAMLLRHRGHAAKIQGLNRRSRCSNELHTWTRRGSAE